MTATIHPFPRTRILRVAHRWRPSLGETVSYLGRPAKVRWTGDASSGIDILDGDSVRRVIVGTAHLKQWVGDRPCDVN